MADDKGDDGNLLAQLGNLLERADQLLDGPSSAEPPSRAFHEWYEAQGPPTEASAPGMKEAWLAGVQWGIEAERRRVGEDVLSEAHEEDSSEPEIAPELKRAFSVVLKDDLDRGWHPSEVADDLRVLKVAERLGIDKSMLPKLVITYFLQESDLGVDS